MNEPRFQTVADLLDNWRDGVLSGTPPELYPVDDDDDALGRLEIGPGLVTLFGGAPGAGKTALTMQLVCEALERTSTLRALVLNVEMPPAILLDRQLARLTGIDATLIRHRRLTAAHSEAIERGMEALERLSGRLAFIRPPFDLSNVAASSDVFEANLLLLDYIQRIGPPGEHGDRRGAVDASMGYLRQFADAGVALIVVAALARSRDSKGRSSYGEGLNLASFRETSELEYGADDAFILTPDSDDSESVSRVVLKHLKSRHGETRNIALIFDRPHQSFSSAEPMGAKPVECGKLQAALRAAWAQKKPADDEVDE